MKRLIGFLILVCYAALFANPILAGPRITELIWIDNQWQLELYNCYYDQWNLDGCYLHTTTDTAWFNNDISFPMDDYIVVQQCDLQSAFTIDPTGTELYINTPQGECTSFCMFGPLCATQPPEPGESLSLVGDVIESTLFVRDASPSMGQPNDDTNISGSFCGYVWDQYAEPLENVVISLAPTSATATTDANGYFELQPYALHYDVHLQYYSLAMADTTISIDPDGVHTAQYQLFVPVDAQNQVLPPQGSISVHPNPFNPNTEIRFQISDSRQREHATIEIFNSKGQKVRKLEMRNEGLEMKRDLSYSLTWNGTNDAGNPVASGVYYARLAVGGMHLAQTKMLLLQ
jgi:hypothetical protein